MDNLSTKENLALSEKFNLNISDFRASKIIWIDTKPELISLESSMENPLFRVCVGVWVGGRSPTNFSQGSQNAQ